MAAEGKEAQGLVAQDLAAVEAEGSQHLRRRRPQK